MHERMFAAAIATVILLGEYFCELLFYFFVRSQLFNVVCARAALPPLFAYAVETSHGLFVCREMCNML